MRCIALVVVAAIASATAPAAADAQDKRRADKLFKDGRRYLKSKEYALACTAFEQSHAADPAIGTQLNIALCYEQWGKVVAAFEAYKEAERLASKTKDKRAKGARKKAAALSAQVPRLTVELPAGADPSAVVLIDGNELDAAQLGAEQRIEPGRHELESRIPGRPPMKTEIELGVGERKVVTVELPPAPIVTPPPVPPSSSPPLPPGVVERAAPRRAGRLYGGIGLVVGGAGAIGAASLVALAARQDYADAIANCPDLRCERRSDFDATQRARTRANYMTVVGIGGTVMVAAGTYLLLTSRGAPEARAAATVEVVPVIAPGTVGVAIGGTL